MQMMKRLLPMGLGLLAASHLTFADPQLRESSTTSPALHTASVEPSDADANCRGVTPERARSLADEAFNDGAYQRAGDCYLVAGDRALADRAFVKALAPASAATAQQLAANRDEVTAQLKKWQQSFRHR